jgi:hypothetical protein
MQDLGVVQGGNGDSIVAGSVRALTRIGAIVVDGFDAYAGPAT